MGKRRLLLFAVGGVLAVALLLRHNFSLALTVGESMRPTLQNGDLLLIYRGAYFQKPPARGDIVVARANNDLVVKRIVGLPEEQVEVKNGLLYINEEWIPESYIATNLTAFNITSGKLFGGKYATLGDNRAMHSKEAFHPIVSKEQILGRVIFAINFVRLRAKIISSGATS